MTTSSLEAPVPHVLPEPDAAATVVRLETCPLCGGDMVIDLDLAHTARCRACDCTIVLGSWD
jgi:hypothetical protein